MTDETEYRERGHNAGIISALKAGRVPIIHTQFLEDRCVLGEVEFADMLTKSYAPPYGDKVAADDMEEIAAQINLLYHDGKPVRNGVNLRLQISVLRRQQRYSH